MRTLADFFGTGLGIFFGGIAFVAVVAGVDRLVGDVPGGVTVALFVTLGVFGGAFVLVSRLLDRPKKLHGSQTES